MKVKQDNKRREEMVKKMKIEKKVELLNKFVDRTLNIACYGINYNLDSYRKGSFFDGRIGRNIVTGKRFSIVVNEAYKKMQKEKKRIKKEKIKNG